MTVITVSLKCVKNLQSDNDLSHKSTHTDLGIDNV